MTPPDLASRAELLGLVALWIDSLDGVLDPATAREYEIYASAQWLTRWKVLGEISTAAIAVMQRARLRQVTRDTLKKERSALSGFLAWCLEQRHLSTAIEMPELPRLAPGKRARPRRERKPLTPAEAKKLLRALPVLSKRHPFQRNQARFRVRDFFAVLWETSLRAATIERISVPENFVKGGDVLEIFDAADKARFHRRLPLTPEARAALDRSCPSSGVIFGAHQWREYLRPISERVLGRRVAVDDFRHSRITRWLEDGESMAAVMYAAGHKHLSTTARYAHPGFDAAATLLGVQKPAGAIRGSVTRKRTGDASQAPPRPRKHAKRRRVA